MDFAACKNFPLADVLLWTTLDPGRENALVDVITTSAIYALELCSPLSSQRKAPGRPVLEVHDGHGEARRGAEGAHQSLKARVRNPLEPLVARALSRRKRLGKKEGRTRRPPLQQRQRESRDVGSRMAKRPTT